jgi:hypothetical protein
VRVKNETYKKLRYLSVDLDIPITRLIDLLYETYEKYQQQGSEENNEKQE